jgi:hypothetical protein
MIHSVSGERLGRNDVRKLIAASLMGAVVALALTSSATAASHNPKGKYAPFKECPLNQAAITDCVYSLSVGGKFAIGKRTVPIVKPLTLQGGFEGEEDRIQFYGAENGDTLSRSPQPVPGGLVGVTAPLWWPRFLQDWFNEEINNGVTAVKATVELTGPSQGLTDISLNTENLLYEDGVALGLPVKFRLENPLLGGNCYLGWDTDPVLIEYTTATDGTLKGSGGTSSSNRKFTMTTISGSELVNNSFSAPQAEGCGGIFSFFIDPLVDSIIGTPAGSGQNSATLESDLQVAAAETVKGSE